ncbi:MAG: molybdenum hydroxylase, partial [Spirochaetes bacterium]|nr:molybdenum hydroxylase [Spirochaetota bacterium]
QGEIIPLLVDPAGSSISALRPAAVIDAIMAKKNTGTNRGMAAVTIALGPGFTAGVDVDIVIETMRGHDLGRLVLKGAAQADTGIPAEVGGRGSQRVIYTRAAGTLRHLKKIGDRVQEGEPLFSVEGDLYTAPFAGVLRGLLREGAAAKGAKAADVDPRLDTDVFSISDKARSVGGAALEAYFFQTRKNGGVV